MARSLRGIIDLGVPPGMSPEEAKYIQMSNFGSLLMIAVNLPYLALCLINGWTLVLVELCALGGLLSLTVFINRRGRHLLALLHFGTLLNLHLIFVTVAMGRETLLPVLIFFTAGGAVTLFRRGRALLMILALAGILGAYLLALTLERAFGPLYRLDPAQTAGLRLFVVYTIFGMVVVNALIGRLGAIFAEDRLREERQRSERLLEQVREQDRQKTQFFQNVSHELRTPLTLILGSLESLLAGAAGRLDEGSLGKLRMIARNARRLLRMINQLLDLSRLTVGKMALQAKRGNLAELVGELVQSFAGYAEKLGIALSAQPELADPWLRFDREVVEKIVSNLLSNACKFTPAGGEVRVCLEESADGRAVRLAVRDTGTGIAPEELERVFDRFYQGRGSTGRACEGAGIGLHLVQELAQLHGGTVTVTSSPGRGSEFVLTLPRAAGTPGQERGEEETGGEGGAAAPPTGLAYARLESAGLDSLLSARGDEAREEGAGWEEAGLAPPPEGRATVLVVDDSADLREYIRRGIEPRCRVLEAAGGAEGLRLAREHLPDLIISDVMMPGMDGYELCRAIRGEETLRLIPVILLTAKAAPEMVIEGLEAGAVDYITKPFSFEVLRARIRGLLQRAAEQERIALRDGLTGLLTRKAWEQETERELKRLARHGGTASLAFLDLDDFKRVNDNCGHAAGDRILVELAHALVRHLRASDLVGRYGGEEFVLLLPDSTGEAAVRSVERVLQQFGGREAGGGAPRCTFSAGVAEIGNIRAPALAEYLRRADTAMYWAKKEGKARVQLWNETGPREARG